VSTEIAIFMNIEFQGGGWDNDLVSREHKNGRRTEMNVLHADTRVPGLGKGRSEANLEHLVPESIMVWL
jgi:hypothetical protein